MHDKVVALKGCLRKIKFLNFYFKWWFGREINLSSGHLWERFKPVFDGETKPVTFKVLTLMRMVTLAISCHYESTFILTQFFKSHTNSVLLDSHKRPALVTDTFFWVPRVSTYKSFHCTNCFPTTFTMWSVTNSQRKNSFIIWRKYAHAMLTVLTDRICNCFKTQENRTLRLGNLNVTGNN